MPVYLYKYLFKGPDVADYSLPPSRDQIEAYTRTRYISSMEAMWFVLGYHTYPPSFPPVQQLPVYELASRSIAERTRENASETTSGYLEKYFARPDTPEYNALTYHAFYENYFVSPTVSASMRESGDYGVISLGERTYYCWKRQRSFIFCRLRAAYPSQGEKFYLRLLLLHQPARSMQGLKTIEGQAFATYQEAAKHLGLIDRHDETYNTLLDATGQATAKAVRRMFATMTIHGFPTATVLSRGLNDPVVR